MGVMPNPPKQVRGFECVGGPLDGVRVEDAGPHFDASVSLLAAGFSVREGEVLDPAALDGPAPNHRYVRGPRGIVMVYRYDGRTEGKA